MSDDAIKTALDAAGQAMARVQGYVDENTTDAAAAAIAAFLDALPKYDNEGDAIPYDAELLAAAIRRAGGAA